MTSRARVSMADVAARAGVSGQTVSRVVNDSPRVDPATRAKVVRAMADLGYRMNRAAQTLRTGRSRTIGLVVSTLASVGNSRMLQAVASAAARRDHTVVVVTVENARGVTQALALLDAQGADGAIILNEASAFALEEAGPADATPSASREGMRVVVVDAPADDRFAVLHTDHVGGARLAVDHLLDQGHQRVAHLAGPADAFAAQERERGWREALAARGVSAPDVARGDWTADAGYAAASALSGASAVFCANDQMALGFVRAVTDMGLRVPEDVSVVGFDDVPDAANYRPPLTTVAQDFDTLGTRALELLIGADAKVSTVAAEVVPVALVSRGSVAAGR